MRNGGKKVGTQKKPVNWGVFIPVVIIVVGAALIGLINNEWLTNVTSVAFEWTLENFAWLYQIAGITVLILMFAVFFSKVGKTRLGGPNAKAKFSFRKWFAMTLFGGIATGLVTYSVNEPIVYFGDVWGELSGVGLEAFSPEASFFAMGRMFYHWSFIPYAMYSLCGLLIAYMYFNRGKELTVSNSLQPIFGDGVMKGFWRGLIDTVSVIAIAIGLAASLGAGLTLVGTGLEYNYGIAQTPGLWLILVAIITLLFTLTSVSGIGKGIQWLADKTTLLFYVLLVFVIIVGPTLYCLNIGSVGIGEWIDHFGVWGFDPGLVDGDALVIWWTMYAWSIWIAYAPIMGIFFAMISHGRTIREFLTVNMILPSVLGIIWIMFWGGTALNWQMNGVVDIAGTISEHGAIAGLWAFVENLPAHVIIVPLLIILVICGFATTANATATSMAVVCTKGLKMNEEPANWMKWMFGLAIGIIAGVMVAFGGGEQGVDGVKYLAATAGFFVLFLFVLQIIAAIKVFFFEQGKVPEVYISEEAKLQASEEAEAAAKAAAEA